MPRDPRIYIEDILEAIRRIGSYTGNMDFVAFAKSPMTIDAVIRNLEVIGEAAGRIAEEIASRRSRDRMAQDHRSPERPGPRILRDPS